MKLLGYVSFLFFVYLFALLPFRIAYLFADCLYYVAFYGIKYRKKVVYDNLNRAYPYKSPEEIDHIAKKFYRYLADIMVESIKGMTMRKKNIIRRHKIINPEVIKDYVNKRQSVIGLTCHYGNWEWGSMSGSLQVEGKILAFYKPLSNVLLDSFARKKRAQCGTEMVSIMDTFGVFRANCLSTCVFLMVADQSPADINRAYWFDFLGLDTAFLHGPEKYSRMYNYPIVYIDIKPVKRGYYELELIKLIDDPSQNKEGEITRAYARMLEQRIEANPQYWMWSHRRWKHNRGELTVNLEKVKEATGV